MTQVVLPFNYQGKVFAPASKSYLQRAIAISILGSQACTIENFYPSKDALAAIRIAKSLGASVEVFDRKLVVKKGEAQLDEVEINCGESGLSTRMFSPIAATFLRISKITGEGSIMSRPINMIEEALVQLGAKTSSNKGLLPLHIEGPILPSEIEIDGSESSQLLTGLLISLPLLQGNSVIKVTNLKSIPYVQMTLDILGHFGIEIKHDNFNRFEIKGGQMISASSYYVEGDWSGASFHLVGGAISGKVTVCGLNCQSTQADKAILDAIISCGGAVSTFENEVLVKKDQLRAFQFDATHSPDLFPPLAVLAACCEGTSKIKGVSRLKNKESNRAQTIREEFLKLNIEVKNVGDVMYIEGSKVKGGKVSSRNDHRIAMATAVLASVADGKIEIENSRAVDKSYPTFFEDLKTVSQDRN
jgi:3-phosphoshikimate 1-carboxyvinyltransferase